ncbi:HAMP domain-containing histidine kinase [bacterium]|nr:HAMP domain-containing histidine kinase [bacterium]
MKKIVRQQNYLKELIESQENQVLSKTALRCIIRGVLEPLLDEPEEGVVLHRILNPSGVIGLLKRLDFSTVKGYDFSDDSGNLKEKVWANTEFLCVLTHRFVTILIWDNKTDNKNFVRYYSVINSKLQNEALDIIGRNTNIDIKSMQESFKPDRRDNILLNTSIRRLIANMDEASKDAVLGFAQIQYEKEENEIDSNTRAVAHEIRNQLSICDLYTEIVKKHLAKNGIKEEGITNALSCIARAIKLAGNSLVALKSTGKNTIKPYKLKNLISSAVDLTKVYFECKDIEYIVENDSNVSVPVDENKFLAVIINLVKNASEAFEEEKKCSGNGKYIKIKTEEDEEFALIRVSDNGAKIEKPEKIFDEGFTTKEKGSGLGLSICKKSIESMYGKLTLEHSEEDYTEFVIRIAKVGR